MILFDKVDIFVLAKPDLDGPIFCSQSLSHTFCSEVCTGGYES